MDAIDKLRWTEEIRALKARYFRLQDTKQWQRYAELFLEDTVFDVTEAFSDPGSPAVGNLAAAVQKPIIGRKAIVDYVSRGLNERVHSFHEGFMPEIEILSQVGARAVWPMEDRVWLADGPVALMHGWGHYHETYTRSDERWHIQSLRLTRIRLELTARDAEGPFNTRGTR